MDRARTGLAIEEKVRATIRRFDLMGPMDADDLVLVAFSGGADSTALALALQQLGYRCVLGHVDHQMRVGSSMDVEHAHRIARDLELPLVVARVEVVPRTEARAREERYRALAEMAAQTGAARIATGHTLDDAAETVIMRRRRGGAELGIPPRRGHVVRPLLEVRRRETEKYCGERGVDYLTDPTNLDLRFTRNRIRAELSTEPDAEIVALAKSGLAAVLEARRADSELAARLPGLVERVDDEVVIKRREFESLTTRDRKGLVRLLLEERGSDPSSSLISQVCRTANRTGSRTDVGPDIAVWTEPEAIVIGRWTGPPVLPEVSLPEKGTVTSSGWGVAVSVDQVDVPLPDDPALKDPISATLDADALDRWKGKSGLVMRQWRDGDRIGPIGSSGHKKLQDIFTDRKVPRRQRHLVPVVSAGDRVVWIAGHLIDDQFKITAATKSAVRITLLPVPSGPD